MQAQTHLHDNKAKIETACEPTYTSIDLTENPEKNDSVDIVIFVEAQAALNLARAALVAYNHLSGDNAQVFNPL